MPLSCEKVARQILPLYRAFVARELVEKYECTQVVAAKKLGTTQAAISQYITSKRGRKHIANYEKVAPLIQEVASKTAQRIVTAGMNPQEFNDSICELCEELRQRNMFS